MIAFIPSLPLPPRQHFCENFFRCPFHSKSAPRNRCPPNFFMLPTPLAVLKNSDVRLDYHHALQFHIWSQWPKYEIVIISNFLLTEREVCTEKYRTKVFFVQTESVG
jgi:hypothetical protein